MTMRDEVVAGLMVWEAPETLAEEYRSRPKPTGVRRVAHVALNILKVFLAVSYFVLLWTSLVAHR